MKNIYIYIVVAIVLIIVVIVWKNKSKPVIKTGTATNGTIAPTVKTDVTGSNICYNPPYTLGCKGQKIEELQLLINQKFGEDLKIDGDFGAKTLNACVSNGLGNSVSLAELNELKAMQDDDSNNQMSSYLFFTNPAGYIGNYLGY